MTAIKHNGNEIKFLDDISLKDFDKLKKKARSNNVDIPTGSPDWWQERTPFGEMFLEKMSLKTHLSLLDFDDWEAYYPIFNDFFVSPEEYELIKNNIFFINGKSKTVIEDYHFIEWILSTKNSIKSKMNFKKKMIFYYYSLLNMIVDNVKKFEELIFKATMENEGMYG